MRDINLTAIAALGLGGLGQLPSDLMQPTGSSDGSGKVRKAVERLAIGTMCASCDEEIPPGRPGRKCKKCRNQGEVSTSEIRT